MRWLHKHQPRLAESLDARREQLQDFAFLRRFSYGCKQVFSGDRWALTGEAGVFLDPFYSPGSDFIAIANTYITELISKDLEGARLARFAKLYQHIYFDFYRAMLPLYVDQYPIFGDPEVRIGVTCVRVPVLRAHAVAVTLECEHPIDPDESAGLKREERRRRARCDRGGERG